METDKKLLSILNKGGFRLTPQRMAIVDLLAGTDTHPTAQAIYEQLRVKFPTLSLATVYNTLETLVKLGVINALGTAGDDAVHYDANTAPHINLACVSCHRVIDLPSRHVHALEEEVAHNSGYQIMGARVLYYGLCPECQEKKQGSSTNPSHPIAA